MSDVATVLGLLADLDRMKVVAALVLGAESPGEVSQVTGLDRRTVGRALSRLETGGLVENIDGGCHLVIDRLAEAARSARGPGTSAGHDLGPHLRNFVREGRLLSIPAARTKRLAILDWLALRFEPGRKYPEREVNLLLGTAHPDVAALRRYLVDEGFLDRREGVYWRVGGTFDVDVAGEGALTAGEWAKPDRA